MALSEQQKQSFLNKGYCLVPGFYSTADMVSIGALVDRMERDEVDSGYKYYDAHHAEAGQVVLTRIERFLFNQEGLDHLVWSPKLRAALTDLLGDEPAIFKDKINFKLPGGRPDLLHQDQAAGWNTYADFFISAAIFLDENTKENAAMSVLKTGDYPRQLMGPEWALMANPEPPFEPACDYQLLEGQPGDVVFFDSFVPHGSPANTSEQRRRNIFITVNRAKVGQFREVYYTDKLKTYPPNNQRDSETVYTYQV